MTTKGWQESTEAWVQSQANGGDFARVGVLDAPMLALAIARGASRALDLGCGEGRFCRMLAARGLSPTGIDPTEAMINAARQSDPTGDYQLARAEELPFEAASFDLVVAYLSLIDIPDLNAALDEVIRVLRPGGHFLIANLNSFVTAALPPGWQTTPDGRDVHYIDTYAEERCDWVAWAGIKVQNWHRPLSTYMQALLQCGLTLRHFAEPRALGGSEAKRARHNRVPAFLVMEWEKSGG